MFIPMWILILLCFLAAMPVLAAAFLISIEIEARRDMRAFKRREAAQLQAGRWKPPYQR